MTEGSDPRVASEDWERRLQRIFSKRLRIVAENAKGRFSSRWIFRGNRSDYYFGAKSVSGALKVSLHENGVGYVAYHKPYIEAKRSEGIAPGR
jgi:hypothetical protein